MESKDNIRDLVIKMKEDVDKYFPAFYELVKKPIYLNIYSYIKDKDETEDILQKTFIRFLDNLLNIKDSSSPLGFLYVISKNLCLDFLKKRGRIISLNDLVESDSHFKSEIADHTSEDYFLYIRSLISEKEYKILLLYTVEDYTHKQISQILKIPIGSVTWSYNNALKKIRKEELKHAR